ncbi:probable WRKY transcription factor 41 [Musa acuminata AAA Group]|uniref:probable WRKY transcription factor 41 n=1 Tax=Musa acuminata AAA Group TaxID=214697 RepID=UPI0031D89D10
MESGGTALDLKLLLRLLAQGEEHTRQLETNLEVAFLVQHCKPLAGQIRSTLKEAISMAKPVDSEGYSRQHACTNHDAAASHPPRSNNRNPRRRNSERVVKEHERRKTCENSKILPKWTSHVSVSSSGAIEALEDGYIWRKYGQKEILGSRHPRFAYE